MAGLLSRLYELAKKRDDLVVTEVDNIDSWGFLLFRDGRYHIYINDSVRDFRKTIALVDELGHYALRRRLSRRHGDAETAATTAERIRADRIGDAWAAKFSRRLLYFVRRGLHGGTSRRPRRGGYDPAWRLPQKG